MTREEAIEVYNGLINTKIKEAFEFFAPELRENESEDERIRQMIENTLRDAVLSERISDTSYREMLVYLEKQNEQKPTGWSDEDDDYMKDLMDYFGHSLPLEHTPHAVRDWLKALSERFGFQPKPECDNETEVQKAYREGKNAGRKEVFDHPEYYGLQLRRMYDYETGKKNPEWSEEDEKMLDLVISNYKYMTRKLRKGDDSDDVAGDIEVFSWLESLPERFNLQPKPEWSEEDEKRIQRICDFLWKNRKGDTDTIYQIEKDADWLKFLCPDSYKNCNSRWKPSEEQMDILDKVYHYLWADRNATADMQDGLGDFIEQLKAL